jgi:heme-degrading monooxygenase HmoA
VLVSAIAPTPRPPYVAVIFTNLQTDDVEGYGETADRMESLAADQPGYLGFETARTAGGLGISVSYWTTHDAARAWKAVAEHAEAQRLGRERWYASYRVRVATVEREYGEQADG